jgi:N-acetylglucosamine-6-phosphate deacetylase
VIERMFLSGADLVLPDRIESGQTLVIERGIIADFVTGPRDVGEGETRVHLPGCTIVPGFVDVHVHGVEGIDVLDDEAAVAGVAARLPKYGVVAFCPTSVACAPAALSSFLKSVGTARRVMAGGARVLPAHLESNFINPDFNGAQPAACLRSPADALPTSAEAPVDGGFSGAEILRVIDQQVADVAIITIASELDGGIRLLRWLGERGVRVSLGHSGATFDQAQAAIAAGAKQATHLFNRMPRMTHREPGLAGAVLASEEIAAELICDGHHVHEAFVRLALSAKGRSRVMAITDATAGAGLPRGVSARIGGRRITVEEVARLEDGTTAGSVATMDRVFGWLVGGCGLNLREAAEVCSTTPAREMGLVGHGVIARGAVADLAVLDASIAVRQTWIAGNLAFSGTSDEAGPSPSS